MALILDSPTPTPRRLILDEVPEEPVVEEKVVEPGIKPPKEPLRAPESPQVPPEAPPTTGRLVLDEPTPEKPQRLVLDEPEPKPVTPVDAPDTDGEPTFGDLQKAIGLTGVRDLRLLKARDRFAINETLASFQPEVAEAVRKQAILEMKTRKFGAFTQTTPSLTRAIKNIPDNLKSIIQSMSAIIAFVPSIISTTAKEAAAGVPLEEKTAFKLGQKVKKQVGEGFEQFKKDPLLTAGFFAEEHPVDVALLGNLGFAATGATLRGVGKVTGIKALTSTARKPLPVGNIQVERHFSKNPLTKGFIQKPFDFAMERYPRLKTHVIRRKGAKITTEMRNYYEQANFNERTLLHKEVFEELEKLSKAEREIIMPLIEGRLHFRKDLPGDVQGLVDLSKGKAGAKSSFGVASAAPRWGRGSKNIDPARVREFQEWYGGFQQNIEKGFGLDKNMTRGQLDDVLYKPIEVETGLPREAIKKELGDFTPQYVNHFFPGKATDKRSIHFTDTTGKRVKPGELKKRKGAEGFSEDLTEVLPRAASSYVKWKNNQAFLEEFTQTFGTPVNLKNIKRTAEGLKVGDTLYPNHKIVAPDGNLRFYKGEVDVWKEISKRMDDTTDFDEAFMDVLADAQAGLGDIKKGFTGVSRNMKVWLVPEEAASRLETFARPLVNQQFQNNVKLFWDTPQQVWKDSVLALSPRWIKNNVMGDIFFNTMEGVGPFSYARGLSGKYKELIPAEVLRASFANVMKYNPRLGKAGETVIGQYLQKFQGLAPVRAAAKAVDLGFRINTAVEQPFVRALYVKLARKKAKQLLKEEGLAVNSESIMTKMAEIRDTRKLSDPIVKELKETLPVFNTLGNFGQKVGRRVSPFLNWYKFMAGYAARLPAKHPFKTVGVRGLGALSEEQREEVFKQYFPFLTTEINRDGINSRFDGLWPIGKDEETGEGIFFNARGMNPFTTIEDFLDVKVVNMLSPIIKVAFERSVGVDVFTGQKYDSPELVEINKGGGVKEVENIKPEFFTHLARQFPQFTLLEQTRTPAQQFSTGTVFNPQPKLDPNTGEPKYPIETLDKMLNYMGVDRKTIDVQDWFLKHRDRIKNKVSQTHKNLLFEPGALTLQEHGLILKEIIEDEELWESIKNDAAQTIKTRLKKKRKKIEAIRENR